MAVGLTPPTAVHPIAGIRLGCAAAGIRKSGKDDLLLIEVADGATAAAVFTRNQFCAAPVVVAREHLARGAPRALLINAGNANAGTGEAGLAAARRSCEAVAKQLGCEPYQVLPFSTGVIGEPLPVERIEQALPRTLAQRGADQWLTAARTIMTTDTIAKAISVQRTVGEHSLTVTGIAKGAGMIRPDMATMLSFIATDAAVPQSLLQKVLVEGANRSFNRITIDGDTSTNDACVLLATGAGACAVADESEPGYSALREAVFEVCDHLAQAIVRDGEGVTKFVTVVVEKGASKQECLQVAYTIAHSPLVKTALFASDPNWGRILAAVGRAGVEHLKVADVWIYLDDVCIVAAGGRADDYTEAQGQAVMAQAEIVIRVVLNRGEAAERVWTSDFSYDYVRINAEYRT